MDNEERNEEKMGEQSAPTKDMKGRLLIREEKTTTGDKVLPTKNR